MSDTPEWIDRSPEEIEDLVLELAEEGKTPAKIGVVLRDRYGIPDVRDILGKNILSILESNDMEPDVPEDLMNLLRKAVNLRDHLDKNSNDARAQRELSELEANIQKLAKYYKREGRLSEDWRYDPEEAALLVRG